MRTDGINLPKPIVFFVKQAPVLIQSEKGPRRNCSTAALELATTSRFCPTALWEASTSPPTTVSSPHHQECVSVWETRIIPSKNNVWCHMGLLSPPPEGWLKVFAMKRGVVGIRGVKTGLYLCMGGDGLPYGAVRVRQCEWRWRAELIVHSRVIFSRISFLTTACWRRTWRRTTTPPTPLPLTRASTWLCPTRESLGRATAWAPTSPAPTSCLGGHPDRGLTARLTAFTLTSLYRTVNWALTLRRTAAPQIWRHGCVWCRRNAFLYIWKVKKCLCLRPERYWDRKRG